MGKLRFYLALWASKLSIPALKITHHNGTDFPGVLAIRICPDFLRYVGKPKTIVAVTGTNGKTTVSNMLTDVLEAEGHTVMSNRAGSNIITGISTAFIRNTSLFGKVKKCDIAVLEVDERSSPRVYPHVKPNYVTITNLTRDSIMRNAHPDFIQDILTRTIPESAKLILNADDLICSGVAPKNDRAYFGIDRLDTDVQECINLINDMRICPKCNGKLRYDYLRYHHIGKAACCDCDFRSPESDYLATQIDFENHTMTMRDASGDVQYHLISDTIYNTYNVVSVIATLRELGFDHKTIQRCFDRLVLDPTRYCEETVGKVRIINQMSKDLNAMAGSRVLDELTQRAGRKEIFLMMNNMGDAARSSENTCWVYDTDFEFLCKDDIAQIVCAGPRALDYRLRLLMAGVPEEKISYDLDEEKAAQLLHFTPGDDVYYLYGADAWDLVNRIGAYLKKLALEGGAEA